MARTDPLRTVPAPAGTWGPGEVFDAIRKELDAGPVAAIVVGWPLSLDDEETEATRMVRSFVKKLKQEFPKVPILRCDERYTSREAVQTMIRSGVPQKKRREKGRVDRIAAALILQQFLELYPEETRWQDCQL